MLALLIYTNIISAVSWGTKAVLKIKGFIFKSQPNGHINHTDTKTTTTIIINIPTAFPLNRQTVYFYLQFL